MAIPNPTIVQSGYRKEITFVDQTFWDNLSATDKPAWSLELDMTFFDRDQEFIIGKFIIEARSGLRINNVKNQLLGQIIEIQIISNSEKLFHTWTTSVQDIVRIEEGETDTAFYHYEITCEFTIPMAEEQNSGSFIDAWWESCN